MSDYNDERSVDRLASILMKIGVLAVMVILCWYFRSVLVYVVIAFVVSLIGQPLMRLFRRIKIRGKSLPDGLLAVLTLIIVMIGALLFITQIIPVIAGIIRDASALHSTNMSLRGMVAPVNAWIYEMFPSVGRDFDIVSLSLGKIKEVVNLSNVSSVLGSVASAAADVAIGIFSVVFISFFFIKDEGMFGSIVCALAPDRVESSVNKTIRDIEHLLSRYFIGLIVEIVGVILLDFLGLWLIVRIGPNYAIGIAFIAGLLNIIPYVGPLLGEAIGVLLCLVLRFGTGVGLDVPVWAFALIVLAVMLAVHMVIAVRFFSDKKVVKRLIPDIEQENTEALI